MAPDSTRFNLRAALLNELTASGRAALASSDDPAPTGGPRAEKQQLRPVPVSETVIPFFLAYALEDRPLPL